MTDHTRRLGPRSPVRTRNVQPVHHDAYHAVAKPRHALVCEDCGIVCHGGRWYWGEPPPGKVRSCVCPACRRVRHRHPASWLRAPWRALGPRREVLDQIRNICEAERVEHPLERVMAIKDVDGDLLITTTGLHIARCIASGLQRRLHRRPSMSYGDDYELRMSWSA